MCNTQWIEHTFDMAWDCPVGEFLMILDKYGLMIKNYIANGPGGGNPCITVTGTIKQINNFTEWYDG